MTAFAKVEEGEEYYSRTTTEEEIIYVVKKREDEIIFETVDDNHFLGKYPRYEWDPDRWAPAGEPAKPR